jgi:hypothetical protein
VFLNIFHNNITAANYYISTTGNDATGNGTSGTPYLTLAKVFSAHNLASGDIIYVAAGTYTEKNITPGTDDEGFTIEGAALDGSGNPMSIFDGNSTGGSWMLLNNYQCDGITIKYLNIKRYTANTIASNEGGGFIRSKIGITGESITNLKIISCLVDECKGNSSQFGGAICFRNHGAPSIEVLSTKFQNCSTDGDGGVIDFASTNTAGGELIINKSIFNNNSCGGNGYAVKISSVATINLSIINSLFYSNISTYSAGYGVILTDAYTIANIINCTIYNNTALSPISAGIYSFGTTNVTNCIIYNNSVKDFYEAGGTLTVSYSNYKNTHSSANVITSTTFTSNPNLTVDFHLSSGSPCINTGTGTPGTSPYPSDDLDGDPRAGAIDIGCYEFDCPTTYSGTYQVGPSAGATWATLTAAIADLKSCMVDDVILELQPTYTDASETYPLNLYGMPTSSGVTLTIRPKSDVPSAITLDGSSATTLIDLNGSDYITFDGRPGGTGTNKYLVIENTSTSTGGNAIEFTNDATNNTIQYCTLKSNFGSSTEGIVVFGDGIASGTGNSNNTIENNIFDGTATNSNPIIADGVADNGIYSQSTTTPSNTSNKVQYNEFKNIFIAQTGRTNTRSIYLVNGNTTWTIKGNYFYDEVARTYTVNTAHSSIEITSGDAYIIEDNQIGGNAKTITGNWTVTQSGNFYFNFNAMKLTLASTNTSYIRRNTIARMTFTSYYSSSNYWKGIEVLSGKVEIGKGSGNGNTIGSNSATSINLLGNGRTSTPIYTAIDVISTSTVDISNNTIGGFVTQNSSGYSVTFNGIKTAGTNGAFTFSSNIIGSTSTANNIQLGGSSTAAGVCTFYGINNAATGLIIIGGDATSDANIIQNVTVYGTGASCLYPINNTGGATNSKINHNTITNLTNASTGSSGLNTMIFNSAAPAISILNNTINTITCMNGNFIGIEDLVDATGIHSIANNTIGSVASNDISVVGGSSIQCIKLGRLYVASPLTTGIGTGTFTINDNTIQNISSSYTGSNSIYGIICNHTGTYNMSGNSIKNLKQIVSNSGGGTISGIYFAAANSSSTIQKNKLIGFSTRLTSGSTISGICSAAAGTVLLYNNLFICDNGSYTVDCKIFGIYDNAAATVNTMYYNTISIGGTQANVIQNPSSSCIFHDNATNSKIQACKNNILQNLRTAGGSSDKHYSYYIGGGTVSLATDYNYYAAPINSNFALVSSVQTIATFNVSTQGFGGTNSKYYSPNGGSPVGNSSPITVNTDGSLSDAHLAIVERGAYLSTCLDDINYVVRATGSSLGGFKGCYEGSCLVVSTQPVSGSICPTQSYSPSISVTNNAGSSSSATLSYQLTYSPDDLTAYTSVVNSTPSNAVYTSSTGSASINGQSATTFSSVISGTIPQGTYYYKFLITTSTGCSITTNSVSLNVNSSPMTTNPQSDDYVWMGSTTAWGSSSNWLKYSGSSYTTATTTPTSSSRVIVSAANSCASAQPILGANVILGSLIIESGASLDANNTGNYGITLSGDWTNNGTFNERSGKVTFNGTASDQTIGGTTSTTFSKLAVNKTSPTNDTLRMNIAANVKDSLVLLDGVIKTSTANNITLLSNAKTGLGNVGSYVNGPLFYVLASSDPTTLNLPIGKGNQWRPAILTVKNATSTSYTYKAELFNASAEALNYTKPITIDRVSSIHYWDINRYATSNLNTEVPSNDVDGNQTISLYYDTNDGVSDAANLTVCKNTATTPNTWEDIGGIGASNTSGSVSSTSNPTSFNSFSRFTLGNKSGGNNILPVQLINFRAFCQQEYVKLNWNTNSEINNDYFSIERSSDGLLFNEITKIKGNGSSNQTHAYEFFDEQSLPGLAYYRLKQVDFNGASTLFPIQTINCFIENNEISIYPNPNSGSFEIKGIQPDEKVLVYDAIGKLIQEKIATSNTVSFSLLDFEEGVYFVQVKNNTGISYFRKILLHK